MRAMGSVSSGLMWMNMDARQQPRQVPQGTEAAPSPELNAARVLRSHSTKLPAGTGTRAGGSSLPAFRVRLVFRANLIIMRHDYAAKANQRMVGLNGRQKHGSSPPSG